MSHHVRNHTVESLLRRAIQRCTTLAYLCGSREGFPAAVVWSGLEDQFADTARDLTVIQRTLSTEAVNGEAR